jgi:hypothetical protein
MADADRPRGPLLVFVHIPKTAGSTLRTVLSMNEPGTRSRALGNVFKGGGGVSTALVERLRKDQGPNLRGVNLVRGHFPLGIREYLPKCLPQDRELRCFTFLREPADRTLSHYFAILAHGRGYQLPPLPAEATVEDALEHGYIHDNLQTRMLSGVPEPFGEVTDEMLEQAKHNLSEELACFGLTERFDESLVLAKRRLGFRSILYTASGRVNTSRPRGKQVPKGLLEAAEACNRYDIELYRYATQLFEAAPEREEVDFEIELLALRTAMAEGDLGEAPPPKRFAGDEQAWRMLLGARTEILRLEFDRRREGIPQIAPTVEGEVRASQLKAARAETRTLEREVARLKTARARTRKLEREVARLEADSARAKELEQQVKRLEEDSARTRELEQQVEQLEAVRERNRKLQQQVGRLKSSASRTEALEQQVETLRAASSRAEELERELEQQVELLDAARSRKSKLEQKVERLKAAAAARK